MPLFYFQRAVGLVDMLHHNQQQAKDNKNNEEETKARYYQQDIRFMRGEQQKDTERKDKARKLRMDVNDDNIRLYLFIYLFSFQKFLNQII